MSLGCGVWSAHLQDRGGAPVRFDIPFSQLSHERVMNGVSSARCTVPMDSENASVCCELLDYIEPWRDELALYRDLDLVWVGPVTDVQITDEGGTIVAQDLFAWMERRFNEEDLLYSGDAADVMRSLLLRGIALEDSINLEVVSNMVGHEVVRRLLGKDFHRIADLVRELGRSAVDFTVLNRVFMGGDLESLMPAGTLVIHDEGVRGGEISKIGAQLATDVIVFGQTLRNADRPVSGRATRAISVFGLLQESFAELLIEDQESAQTNANGRLESMQPSPRQLRLTLDESAQPAYEDLIPGRMMDVRLARVVGCGEVNDSMRLQSMSVQVAASEGSVTEDVEINLIPEGVRTASVGSSAGELVLPSSIPSSGSGAGGVSGPFGHVIEDEGSPLPQQPVLNFVGAGVTATDGNNESIVTIPGGISGVNIEDEGTLQGSATTINFAGDGVTASVAASEATITVLATGFVAIEKWGVT